MATTFETNLTEALSNLQINLPANVVTDTNLSSKLPTNVVTTEKGSTLYASKSENNSKVAISGNRGQLAGMETPANGTVVNGTSADSMTATGNVTVQTGAANTAWTKAVTINNAGYTVTLNGSWHWVGGKAPEIKVPGILVCHWNSSVGLANYISGAA